MHLVMKGDASTDAVWLAGKGHQIIAQGSLAKVAYKPVANINL